MLKWLLLVVLSAGSLIAAEVVEVRKGTTIEVRQPEEQLGEQVVLLWFLDESPGRRYAVALSARLTEATEPAEVVMINNLAGGESFFTKTAAELGPMSPLKPNGEWRDVILPGDATNGSGDPEKLEIKVNLPAGGKFEAKDFTLYRLEPADNPLMLVPAPEQGAGGVTRDMVWQWLLLGLVGVGFGFAIGIFQLIRARKKESQAKVEQK